MLSKVFAIHDSKAEAYLAPFFMTASGMAVRAFADLANDRQSNVGRHPGDYKLYQVGTFDDQSGVFENIQPPTYLGTGSDFVEAPVPLRGVVS